MQLTPAQRAAAACVPRRPARRSSSVRQPAAAPLRRLGRAGARVTVQAAAGDGGDGGDDTTSALPSEDWRAFRARLVALNSGGSPALTAAPSGAADAEWAHPLVAPEAGCVLLAHPKLFSTDQPYFFRSVIFLFDHGPNGSAGIILNRPTEYKIGGIEGAGRLLPQFADERLYLGGDVGRSTMHLLHGRPELRDSREIVAGVAVGGFEAARDAVATQPERYRPDEFRFFTRYCGWGPGQLDREVRSGVWRVAACSRAVLLAQPPKGGPHAMWARILTLAGGDYARVAADPDWQPGAEEQQQGGSEGGGAAPLS